jgi:hypothetical protein
MLHLSKSFYILNGIAKYKYQILTFLLIHGLLDSIIDTCAFTETFLNQINKQKPKTVNPIFFLLNNT